MKANVCSNLVDRFQPQTQKTVHYPICARFQQFLETVLVHPLPGLSFAHLKQELCNTNNQFKCGKTYPFLSHDQPEKLSVINACAGLAPC